MNMETGANNAVVLREALERLLKWVDVHTSIYSIRVAPIEDDPEAVRKEKDDAVAMARAALSAPARNCDKYSHDEALHVWAAEKEGPNNGCFDEWLYHNATEGGMK